MNSKKQLLLWLGSTRSHYFLIPETHNISTGDFILFNLTGEKKEVALTAITSFEITEEEAMTYLETELNQLIEQIEISKDVQQELPKMLEQILSYSNVEKHILKIINKLGEIEDKLEENPELLQQVIYEFYTSLSEEFFSEREKQLEEQRQQEYKQSAKDAIAKSLSFFAIPSFADKDWLPEINFFVDKDK
jgi:hypothetical protein